MKKLKRDNQKQPDKLKVTYTFRHFTVGNYAQAIITYGSLEDIEVYMVSENCIWRKPNVTFGWIGENLGDGEQAYTINFNELDQFTQVLSKVKEIMQRWVSTYSGTSNTFDVRQEQEYDS